MTNQMVTWPSGKESILPSCWTEGRDIKHLMSHGRNRPQGAKDGRVGGYVES